MKIVLLVKTILITLGCAIDSFHHQGLTPNPELFLENKFSLYFSNFSQEDQIFEKLHPWHDSVASIMSVTSNGQLKLCSGVLISPKVILTAAHCFSGVKSLKNTRIYFRKVNLFDHSPDHAMLTFSPKKLAIHPKYSIFSAPVERMKWDIALIVINNPIHSLKPLPIRTKTENSQNFLKWYILGWGDQGKDDIGQTQVNHDGFLRMMEIPSISSVNEEIIRLFFDSRQKAACSGDSGGPILSGENPNHIDNMEVVGIFVAMLNVFLETNCRTATGFFAVNVQKHSSWILNEIRRLSGD